MKRQRAETTCSFGKQTGNIALMIGAVISLVMSALCRFVLPGVRFSSTLFLCLAALCGMLILLNFWAARSDRGQICRRIVWCGLCAAAVIFLVVEAALLSYGEREAPEEPVSAVIVLGAGVNGTTPSLTLRTRIEAVRAYLEKYPETPAVLSGGQGPGEDITEAQAMYNALVGAGIPSERLLLEGKSTSTEENIAFSIEVLKKNDIDTSGTIAIVTNDFHQLRAQMIAGAEGLAAVGIAAELPWWWLNANYYVREFFALGKLWLTGLLA